MPTSKAPKDHFTKRIAKTYDNDFADIYQESREMAYQLLCKHYPKGAKLDHIVDCAIGTAESYPLLQRHLVFEQFTGVDLSSAMLKVAQKKFPTLTTVNDSAMNIAKHFQTASIDLALCFTMFSYLDWRELLTNLKPLLKQGGCVCITTATSNNLCELQQRLEQASFGLFDREKQVLSMKLPESTADLAQELEQLGYHVIASDTYRKPISFTCFQDTWSYVYKSGWLLPYFNLTKNHLIDRSLFRLAGKLLRTLRPTLRYPQHMTTELAVILISA